MRLLAGLLFQQAVITAGFRIKTLVCSEIGKNPDLSVKPAIMDGFGKAITQLFNGGEEAFRIKKGFRYGWTPLL